MIKLLYIDLFCGAGGTSTGVENARYADEQCAKVIACVVEIDGYGKRIIDTGYLNVDESYLVPDWEQRRYEIAKECVAVLMSGEMTLEDAAKLSVEQADALITELKKKNKV